MSTPKLIDVHTHTQFAVYNADQDAVIRRALEVGIWMINVGTQRDTSKAAIEVSHKYENVWATVGLHPIHTEKSFHDEQELGIESAGELQGFTSRGEEFDYDAYKNLALDPKVVAIGECGLDYYRIVNNETRNLKQKKIFEAQIGLSREVKKPLMIHCREAFKDLIDTLQASRYALHDSNPGVIHFFSGTIEDAKKLMDLGFSFSFGGVLTFPPRLAERSRGEAGGHENGKIIKFIPLERIVLETDAPYVAPQAYRGKRNEPLYVEEVAKKIARILDKDFEEIAETTTKNAIRIFGLRRN